MEELKIVTAKAVGVKKLEIVINEIFQKIDNGTFVDIILFEHNCCNEMEAGIVFSGNKPVDEEHRLRAELIQVDSLEDLNNTIQAFNKKLARDFEIHILERLYNKKMLVMILYK